MESIIPIPYLKIFIVVKHIYFYFIFWSRCMGWVILVPWPGIEPMPPAVEARGPNHWTARELP